MLLTNIFRQRVLYAKVDRERKVTLLHVRLDIFLRRTDRGNKYLPLCIISSIMPVTTPIPLRGSLIQVDPPEN